MEKRDFFLHPDDVINITVGMATLEGSKFLSGDRAQYRVLYVTYFTVSECVPGTRGEPVLVEPEVSSDEVDSQHVNTQESHTEPALNYNMDTRK